MQNKILWKKLLIDGLVIAGSILLAFSIDAWWDRTQQIKGQDELLSRLEEAISFSNDRIIASLGRLPEHYELLDYYLNLKPNDMPEISSERANSILVGLIETLQSSYNSDILLALLDSGNTILLDNAVLLERLTTLRRQLNRHVTFRETLFVLRNDMVKVMGKHPEIIPYINKFGKEGGMIPESGGNEAIYAALNDTELASLAVNKGDILQTYEDTLRLMLTDSEDTLLLIRGLIR